MLCAGRPTKSGRPTHFLLHTRENCQLEELCGTHPRHKSHLVRLTCEGRLISCRVGAGRCQNDCNAERRNNIPENWQTQLINASKSYLSPLWSELFHSQFTAHQWSPQGYCWSVKEKLYCLQLHYKSPEHIALMSQHFVLTSPITIRKLVSNTIGWLDTRFSDIMLNMQSS